MTSSPWQEWAMKRRRPHRTRGCAVSFAKGVGCTQQVGWNTLYLVAHSVGMCVLPVCASSYFNARLRKALIEEAEGGNRFADYVRSWRARGNRGGAVSAWVGAIGHVNGEAAWFHAPGNGALGSRCDNHGTVAICVCRSGCL